MKYEGHEQQKFGCESYSQHGEDLFLLNVFDLLGLPNFTWLDIGAHHPTDISNTALFYKKGNRGTNVEANPYLMAPFCEERSEDNNICIGVAGEDGERDFYMVDQTSGLNSFCLEELNRVGIPPISHRPLKCISINNFVDTYLGGIWPQLLLTDAEGLDYEILHAAEFDTSKPHVICAEVRPHEAYKFKMMLFEKGYFSLCRITANLIFCKLEHWDKMR